MSTRTTFLTEELYQYLKAVSLREPQVLQELRESTSALTDKNMQIAPEQGQFMALLIELTGAKKALELGVYTGYSSTAVALALPKDGQLIACDINDEWTQLARKFWEKAGVSHKITFHLGVAIDLLDKLIDQGEANSFDFIFIDADKTNYDVYYEKSLSLAREGGLIVIDNTFRSGAVIDSADHKVSTESIRNLNQKLLLDQRISLSLLPIGDGLTLARKRKK